jgi:hypothetical protein
MKNEYFKIECICIHSDCDAKGIQKGKVYTCEGHIDSIFYSVTTSNKYYGVFEKKKFITFAEWRDKQINSILYD